MRGSPGELVLGRHAKSRMWLLGGLVLGVLLIGWLIYSSYAPLWSATSDLERSFASAPPRPVVVEELVRRAEADPPDRQAVEPAIRAALALAASERASAPADLFARAGYIAARYGTADQAATLLEKGAGSRLAQLSLGLGALALRSGDFVAAREAFERATREHPESADAWTRLGTCLLQLGLPYDSINALERAAGLAPRDADVAADLAEAYSQASRLADALAAYKRAAALEPENLEWTARVAATQARLAVTDSELEEADRALSQAIEASPGSLYLLLHRAGLRLRRGMPQEARSDFETALRLEPRARAAWHNLAIACERMGDSAAAEVAHKRFRELTTQSVGLVKLRREELRRPNDARVKLRLAQALHAAGRSREAFAILSRAAELAPDDREIQGLLEVARRYFQEANQPAPGSPSGPFGGLR